MERGRGPAPFLLEGGQTTQQEPAQAEVALDHRERSLAWMTTLRVKLLRHGRRHFLRVLLAMGFMLA